jgi:molybdate/tungstate transport system ATP-binding protein
MITLEGISVRLGVFSLDDVSLRIRAGECYGLLGPSGAGKTVLLETIAGFHHPEKGKILIRGTDVTSLPPENRHIGLVYQDYSLFPHMTGIENISFGLRMAGIPGPEAKRRAWKILSSFGIAGLADRYPATMSGGERQRCAIARALAVSPDLLLLDEPFAALDPVNREGCIRLVRDVLDDGNCGVLLVTHAREEILALADRAGTIAGGRLGREGAPKEIMSYTAADMLQDSSER